MEVPQINASSVPAGVGRSQVMCGGARDLCRLKKPSVRSWISPPLRCRAPVYSWLPLGILGLEFE